MWHDVGLISSVAGGAWLALDAILAEGWRRRSVPLGIMGASGAIWAGSELLLRTAEEPWEFALCRRLLYLGVCVATFSWYWVAVEADGPGWFQTARWRAALPALPLAFTYALLFLAPDGVVISLYTPEPAHGPVWYVHALGSWLLVAAGLVHYARAGARLRRKSRRRLIALAAGVVIPLGLNMSYAAGALATDPAPCMLGIAAILIRFAVVDTGLTSRLPLAHSDVIEQLAVGVVVSSIDDRVIDANPYARRLLGESQLDGKRLAELTAELDPRIEVMRFPLQSHHGLTATAAVLTDRRAAVEAEQRLQLAGRLEAIGSLTAGIAHEVNNPLAYIYANLGSLEKLVTELSRPEHRAALPDVIRDLVEDAPESVADVRDGFDRISVLVSRLKEFAKGPQAPDTGEPIDLEVSARRAAAMAGIGLAEEAISVRATGPTLIRASDHIVGQILVNLMLNAVQASGDSPRVDVEIRGSELDAEIRICDRGRGLAKDEVTRIFDPFYTTKRSGTGLGLSISFDLARRLGGRIEAAARDGGGATFTLFLPRAGTHA